MTALPRPRSHRPNPCKAQPASKAIADDPAVIAWRDRPRPHLLGLEDGEADVDEQADEGIDKRCDCASVGQGIGE